MTVQTNPTEPDAAPRAGAGGVVLTATGLAAAFGVASCCGLPFMLATAGLGTGWLWGIAALAFPHRSLLMAVAAISLMLGAGLFWRQRRVAACAAGGFCDRPLVRGLNLIGLLAGLVLLWLGYAYA